MFFITRKMPTDLLHLPLICAGLHLALSGLEVL